MGTWTLASGSCSSQALGPLLSARNLSTKDRQKKRKDVQNYSVQAALPASPNSSPLCWTIWTLLTCLVLKEILHSLALWRLMTRWAACLLFHIGHWITLSEAPSLWEDEWHHAHPPMPHSSHPHKSFLERIGEQKGSKPHGYQNLHGDLFQSPSTLSDTYPYWDSLTDNCCLHLQNLMRNLNGHFNRDASLWRKYRYPLETTWNVDGLAYLNF